MENKFLAGLLILVLIASTASAAPISITANVNGMDPAKGGAVVKAGTSIPVSIILNVEGTGLTLDSVEVNSDPSALGAVIEAYVEKKANLPAALKPDSNSNYYDVPEYLPGGEYTIDANLNYGGSQSGTYNYKAKITVQNEGALSTVLGLLLSVLPKFLVKPLVSALL